MHQQSKRLLQEFLVSERSPLRKKDEKAKALDRTLRERSRSGSRSKSTQVRRIHIDTRKNTVFTPLSKFLLPSSKEKSTNKSLEKSLDKISEKVRGSSRSKSKHKRSATQTSMSVVYPVKQNMTIY